MTAALSLWGGNRPPPSGGLDQLTPTSSLWRKSHGNTHTRTQRDDSQPQSVKDRGATPTPQDHASQKISFKKERNHEKELKVEALGAVLGTSGFVLPSWNRFLLK